MTAAAALILKVTLVFAAAGAIAAMLHARSAATRHWIWLCALGASVALLPLLPLAPRWRVPLPAPLARVVPVAAVAPTAAPSAFMHAPASSSDAASGSGSRPARAGGRALPLTPPAAIAFAWLAGTALLLARQLTGAAGLRRLEAGADSITDLSMLAELDAVGRRFGIRSEVRLLESPRVRCPLTWGWGRAIVVLPSGWRDWPAERRRMALTHELAHVARGDFAAQRLAALACALYWFHPLAWIAAACLRNESERACDDRVLGAGAAAPEYAQELLAFARDARLQRRAGAMAIGMARPTQIEGRLLAMLDTSRSRAALSSRTAALAAALALLALVPLAGLTVRRVAAGTPGAGGDRHVDAGTLAGTTESHVERTLPARAGGTLTLDLPAGAAVDIEGWRRDEVSIVAQLAGRNWRETSLTFDSHDGGVAVHLRPIEEVAMYSSSHALVIRVPSRYDLDLESGGGRLAIHDVEGRFEGHTGGGAMELEHLRGHANLTTGGGSIQVSDCTLSGSVSTGGGRVRLANVQGGLRAWSGSEGHITSGDKDEEQGSGDEDRESSGETGEGAKDGGIGSGLLRRSIAGGDLVYETAPHGASLHTAGGEIHVGAAGGDVSASTGGGNIELGPVAGSVRASTGAGAVRIALADARGRPQDIEVRSGTGRVVLELPRTLDATFDLETAYTRDHDGPTRIASDFTLERSETTSWDSREGTPRRYVRAKGVSGSGRGHVTVRTVNGDIEVRHSER
jgi:beta-lactamase regulating signal transducer with metallopeptidase domain